MDFEFDPVKSGSNKGKHGIDFVQAQALWQDESRVEAPSSGGSEPRFLIVGIMSGKHWTAVITYRGERARIISVRRAREEEVALYEEDQH